MTSDPAQDFGNRLREAIAKIPASEEVHAAYDKYVAEPMLRIFTPIVVALKTTDELGKVLRIHFLLEEVLHLFIRSRMINPEAYEPELDRMPFQALVRLAESLGLTGELRGALGVVHRVRNHFAHNNKHAVSPEDVDALLNASDGYVRNALDKLLAAKPEHGPEAQAMDPATKFCMGALILASAISENIKTDSKRA